MPKSRGPPAFPATALAKGKVQCQDRAQVMGPVPAPGLGFRGEQDRARVVCPDIPESDRAHVELAFLRDGLSGVAGCSYDLKSGVGS